MKRIVLAITEEAGSHLENELRVYRE